MPGDSNRHHPRLSRGNYAVDFPPLNPTISHKLQAHHYSFRPILARREQSHHNTVRTQHRDRSFSVAAGGTLTFPRHAYVTSVTAPVSLTRKEGMRKISVPAASSALFRMAGIVSHVRLAANLLNAASSNRKRHDCKTCSKVSIFQCPCGSPFMVRL